MKIKEGSYRLITDLEKQNDPQLKDFIYTVTDEYVYKEYLLTPSLDVTIGSERKISVPVGFCSDGSSGGPDVGCSWIFHDYLYSTHCFQNGSCTRKEADEIMYKILKKEGRSFYAFVLNLLAKSNPFYFFSRAWIESGQRGPIFISPNDE